VVFEWLAFYTEKIPKTHKIPLLYSMKIKEQTRNLAVGCSKHCFEVADRTDEVSSKHCFEVVDKTDKVSSKYCFEVADGSRRGLKRF